MWGSYAVPADKTPQPERGGDPGRPPAEHGRNAVWGHVLNVETNDQEIHGDTREHQGLGQSIG